MLCYIIFYFSCFLTKNKIWLWKSKDNKFDVNIQKTIIHTLIDLINSIMEANMKKEKKLLYEMLTTRWMNKVKTIYRSDKIYQKIKENNDKKN